MFQNFLFCLFFCFLLLSKHLCGKFKNFKTNKAILTIVIKRKESDNDENILRKYFRPKEKNHSEVCLGLIFGCGLCYLGQKIRSNHLNIFFFSVKLLKRWCRTTWQMKCCSYPNIFDLVLEKEMQLNNCWISLFSLLKRMTTLPRQTWKKRRTFHISDILRNK